MMRRVLLGVAGSLALACVTGAAAPDLPGRAETLGTPGSDWPIYTVGFDPSQGPTVRDGMAMAYAVFVFDARDTIVFSGAAFVDPTWTADTGELANNVWAPNDMGVRLGPKFRGGYRLHPYGGVSNSCDRWESDQWTESWCEAMDSPCGDQAFSVTYVSGPPVVLVPGRPDTLAIVAFSVDPDMQPGMGFCDTVDRRGVFAVSELFQCDEMDTLMTDVPSPVDEETWGRVKALYR
jgi:hypothetical protein